VLHRSDSGRAGRGSDGAAGGETQIAFVSPQIGTKAGNIRRFSPD
jgi:hypothetical protein